MTPGSVLQIMLRGTGVSWDITLGTPESRLVVGTDPSCSWPVEAPGVLGRHLELYWDGMSLWACDASNGGVGRVRLNGAPLNDWQLVPVPGLIEFASIFFDVALVQPAVSPTGPTALAQAAPDLENERTQIASPDFLDTAALQGAAANALSSGAPPVTAPAMNRVQPPGQAPLVASSTATKIAIEASELDPNVTRIGVESADLQKNVPRPVVGANLQTVSQKPLPTGQRAVPDAAQAPQKAAAPSQTPRQRPASSASPSVRPARSLADVSPKPEKSVPPPAAPSTPEKPSAGPATPAAPPAPARPASNFSFSREPPPAVLPAPDKPGAEPLPLVPTNELLMKSGAGGAFAKSTEPVKPKKRDEFVGMVMTEWHRIPKRTRFLGIATVVVIVAFVLHEVTSTEAPPDESQAAAAPQAEQSDPELPSPTANPPAEPSAPPSATAPGPGEAPAEERAAEQAMYGTPTRGAAAEEQPREQLLAPVPARTPDGGLASRLAANGLLPPTAPPTPTPAPAPSQVDRSQRQAIDVLISGRYGDALKRYQELSTADPQNAAYRAMIRILQRRIKEQCRDGIGPGGVPCTP